MTLASEGFIADPIGWPIHCVFTGTRRHFSAIAQAGATPLPASGEAAAQQPASAPRLLVSFARRWSRRQERMDYRSIFLSASYGK